MNKNINLAIRDLARGEFVLIYDIDGREEEVDLVCLAHLGRRIRCQSLQK